MKAMQVGGQKAQSELLRNIFKAYQEDEQDLCDLEMLSDLAEGSGVMTKAEVRRFFSTILTYEPPNASPKRKPVISPAAQTHLEVPVLHTSFRSFCKTNYHRFTPWAI